MHQLSLLIIAVVISGALCGTDNVVLQCQKPERSVFINKSGRVSTRSKTCPPQFFMIENHHNLTIPDKFKITLRVYNTEMYLCLGNETMEWKPVGRKGKHETLPDLCYFTEMVKNGYFQFRSVVDETKILHLKSRNGNCTSFQKLNNSTVSILNGNCKPHRRGKKREQERSSNSDHARITQQHQDIIHIRHNHTHIRRINHDHKKIISTTTTTTTTTTTKSPLTSDTGIISKNYGKRGRKRRIHKPYKNAKLHHQHAKHRNSRKAQIHTRSESLLNRSVSNIQDEYSNDDASAIVVLPNSSTESQYTSNSSPKYSSSNKPIRKRKSSRLSRVNANHNTIPDS